MRVHKCFPIVCLMHTHAHKHIHCILYTQTHTHTLRVRLWKMHATVFISLPVGLVGVQAKSHSGQREIRKGRVEKESIQHVKRNITITAQQCISHCAISLAAYFMDQHCAVQLDTDSKSSGIWLVEIGRICSQTDYVFFFVASLVLCSCTLFLTAFVLLTVFSLSPIC